MLLLLLLLLALIRVLMAFTCYRDYEYTIIIRDNNSWILLVSADRARDLIFN